MSAALKNAWTSPLPYGLNLAWGPDQQSRASQSDLMSRVTLRGGTLLQSGLGSFASTLASMFASPGKRVGGTTSSPLISFDQTTVSKTRIRGVAW